MKIKAITADQMIIINGEPVKVSSEGFGFVMPNNEWAVSFDSESGVGEVEYTDFRNNETIGVADYAERYQFLEQHFTDARAVRDQRLADELAAAEAAATEAEPAA